MDPLVPGITPTFDFDDNASGGENPNFKPTITDAKGNVDLQITDIKSEAEDVTERGEGSLPILPHPQVEISIAEENQEKTNQT